jgi:hypothetical protein
MHYSTKRIAFLLFLLTLVSILLLAPSLTGLELQPGAPFPGSEESPDTEQQYIQLPPGESLALPIMQGIFALLLVGAVVYTLVRLIMRRELRKFIVPLLMLVAAFVIVSIIPRMDAETPMQPIDEIAPIQIEPEDDFPITPLGEPPQIINWLVMGAIASGLVLVAVAVSRWTPPVKKTVDKLQEQAEDALDALNSGANFKDVIIRCYMQMAYVLQAEQGVKRRDPMTVREFESLLTGKGIPASPVHALTRLFEQVRYGHQPASQADQQLGMGSLADIVGYCQAQKQGGSHD